MKGVLADARTEKRRLVQERGLRISVIQKVRQIEHLNGLVDRWIPNSFSGMERRAGIKPVISLA